MATHDYDIANQSGSLFRSDLNSVLSAIVSMNSSASAPVTTFAYMIWCDTTNGLIKQRNAANTQWIVRGSLHESRSVAESSGFTVGVDDYAKFYTITGTTTATLTAAATLGAGFWFLARNDGSAIVTIDPNASETINANTTMVLMPGQGAFVWCNGSNWFGLFFDQRGSAGQSVIVANQAEVLRLQTKVDDTGDCYLSFYESSGARKGYVGFLDTSSDLMSIGSEENADVRFTANASEVFRMMATGYLLVNFTSDQSAQLAVKNTGSARSAIRGVNTAADGYSLLGYHNNDTATAYVGYLLSDAAAGTGWQFLSCVSDANGTPDQEFNLRGDGNGFCDGSFTGGGADFAEMFEWADGNPDCEDRVGCTVSLIADKIRVARPGDHVIGVVSACPTIIGNAAWNKWASKYLRDDFGRYVMQDGRRVLNPDFRPDARYTPRSERPEWAVVGIRGRVRVRKGQQNNPNWVKLRNVSDQAEEWLV